MAIADVLQYCCHLETLILTHNAIGDYGAVALVGAMLHCNHLKILDLAHNGIGVAGVKAIANLLLILKRQAKMPFLCSN